MSRSLRLLFCLVIAVLAGCDGGSAAGMDASAPRRDAPFVHPDVPRLDGAYTPRSGTCGLDSPAFCETFESGPSGTGGSSGELDPSRWSVTRGGPGDTSDGAAFRVPPGHAPNCRPGVTGEIVGPDNDVFVCEPTDEIATRHLATTVASQNYGVHGYRIQQPFDFTGRMGTLAFDADLRSQGDCGFVGVTLAADPTPRPSFGQFEHATGPRNGVEIMFNGNNCHEADTVSPGIRVFRDYVEVEREYESGQCFHVREGALEHVEIYVSSSHLEVWVSDASPDGEEFSGFHLAWGGDIDLPFERAHVTLAGYNHASIKYWCGAEIITRWDDVGFDGPRIEGFAEYGVPDSLESREGVEGCHFGGGCVWVGDLVPNEPHDVCGDPLLDTCWIPEDAYNVGYRVPNVGDDALRLEIPGVRLAGATRAALVLYAWYPYFEWQDHMPADYGLHYRVNGGAWHDRLVTDIEVQTLMNPEVGLEVNQIIDVELAELIEGTNVLEVQGTPDNTGYPIGIQAINLRVETD